MYLIKRLWIDTLESKDAAGYEGTTVPRFKAKKMNDLTNMTINQLKEIDSI